MLLGEGLVVKLGPIDGLAARAVALCEVTTLDHELLDYAVEHRALVVQRLAGLADAFLASAESTEILGRLGNKIVVQLHRDAANGLVPDRDVEEDPATGALVLGGPVGRHGCGR